MASLSRSHLARSLSRASSKSSAFQGVSYRLFSSSAPEPVKPGQLKAQKKADDKLRRAIELYHLTPLFLPCVPTPASSSSPATPERGAVGEAEKDLDRHISHTFLEDFYPMTFKTLTELVSAESKDAATSYSLHKSNNDDADLPERVIPTSRIPLRVDGEQSSLDDDDPTMAARRRRRAGFRTRAEFRRGVDRATLAPDDRLYGERGARIRDALFGTINEDLVGLETLRERVEEKKKRGVLEGAAPAQ